MKHPKPSWILLFLFFTTLSFHGKALSNENVTQKVAPVVERHQRRKLTETEYGEVSAIDIQDGYRPPYHLQFFTLDPNSLFLPVLLHADMVFYVQTGTFMFLTPHILWRLDSQVPIHQLGLSIFRLIFRMKYVCIIRKLFL